MLIKFAGVWWIICLSLSGFCCGMFIKNTTELEKHLSQNGLREVTVIRIESGGVKYITLLTKTNGKELWLQNPIYYEKDEDGDLSPDFTTVMLSREWINDQIFFIGFNNDYIKSNDTISIKNISFSSIEQFELNVEGHYIVYSIQPNEIVKVPVSWNVDNEALKKDKKNSFLKCTASVKVDFSNGNKILPGAAVFQFIQSDDDKSKCGSGEIIVGDKDVQFKVLPE
jgi:hypothetical protein